MTLQPKDDDLDPYEAYAQDRLTPLLGPLRRTAGAVARLGNTTSRRTCPTVQVAALEVTVEVDDQRLDLAAPAKRRLSSITLPNSESRWLVGLAAGARVNALRPDDLRRLLGQLEASGRHDAHDMGDYRDPFVARLRGLGIESVYAVSARAGSEGM